MNIKIKNMSRHIYWALFLYICCCIEQSFAISCRHTVEAVIGTNISLVCSKSRELEGVRTIDNDGLPISTNIPLATSIGIIDQRLVYNYNCNETSCIYYLFPMNNEYRSFERFQCHMPHSYGDDCPFYYLNIVKRAPTKPTRQPKPTKQPKPSKEPNTVTDAFIDYNDMNEYDYLEYIGDSSAINNAKAYTLIYLAIFYSIL